MNGQAVARKVTDAVVRRPWTWRFFRGRMQRVFDELAPTWETRLGPHHLLALRQAVAGLEPQSVVDICTGTGKAAIALAEWFPDADVVGVDLSPAMVAEAERRTAGRVRFQVADASSLAFPDESFDLVVLMNAIPFFDELARITAPGGVVVNSFSRGPETPIYVSDDRLRRELSRRGFGLFASFAADPATALRARKL